MGILITDKLVDTKGSIPVDTGVEWTTIPPGPDAYILTADSTQPLGLKWSSAGSGTGTVTSVATGTGLTGGPITAAGTVSIAAGGVNTTELAAAGVTYAKVQNVAASAILGNPTGSPAAPSEITLGSGLSFSGTTLVASGGGGSGTVNSGTIGQVAYYAGTGTAVSGEAITTLIGAGGIGTTQLAAAGVTYAKVQNVAATALLGNPTGSPAAPSEITLGANLSFSGTTLVATGGGTNNPGGTSNQIQYNSAGSAFGGFTLSGDASLVVATGVITVGSIGGVSISLAGAFSTSGAHTLSLTTQGATAVTLPTSGFLLSTASAVTAAQGGTGLGTLTAHAVMLGEGTSNVAFATIGTAGRLLIDQGAAADPAFEAMSGDATIASTGAITVSKIGGTGITLAGAFSTVGAYTIALTATNTTALTLPTSGTLATTAVATLSSLTSVGTIGTGVWQGTPVVPTYGGTGLATLTAHAVMLGEGTSNVGFATIGTTGRILADQGSGADPAFVTTGLQIDSHQGVITTDTQSTGTWTCNLATSDWHAITLTQSITTLTLSNPTVGQQFTLAITQGGSGSYTVAWFTTIKWPGGTAPTLTTTVGKTDIVTFKCYGSGTYYGLIVGQNL